MQLFVDFFPLLLFFAAYLWQGIFFATGVAIVASVLQIAWIHWKHGRAGVTHWLSLVIIVVFGGATLLLQDKTFIMWKPTVLYGLFGAILAVGKLGFGRDLIAYLMKGVNLTTAIWSRLTWAWVAFFVFMGVANWYVAFHYSEQTWVLYKVWGGIGLFLVFAILQGVWLARHASEETAMSAEGPPLGANSSLSEGRREAPRVHQ